MMLRIHSLLSGWYVLISFIVWFVPSQSRPSGASSCIAGGPAVQGSHVLGSPGRNGTLPEGGFTLAVNGEAVAHNTSNITVKSLDFDVVITGRGYRGILIRVGGAASDQVVTPTRGLTSDVAICGTVGAVTHINNTLKPSATASISLDEPVDLQVDITVVVVNNSTTMESIFYYTGLTIQVVGESMSQAPSLSPIDIPNVTLPTQNVSSSAPVNAPSTLPSFNIPSSIPIINPQSDSPTTNIPAESVVEVITRNSQLLVLEDAAARAGILNSLSDPLMNFTLFAPNDEAFQQIDPKYLEDTNWTIHLRSLLAYHVVPRATYLTMQLTDDREVNTVLEEHVFVSMDAKGVLALSGPLFESQVLQADAVASNGVVHVVDAVFLPPFLELSLFDVLNTENRYFSVMMTLIARAGLEDTLTDMKQEYTLLAPTNQALLALNTDERNGLNNDTDLLVQVLSHHVIKGIYPSARLQNQSRLNTLAGTNISVAVTANGTFVLDEKFEIIGVDSGVAGNGLIHVLGSVMLPPSLKVLFTDPPSTSPTLAPVSSRPNPPMMTAPHQNSAKPSSIPPNRTQNPKPVVLSSEPPSQSPTSLLPNATSSAAYSPCGICHPFTLSLVLAAKEIYSYLI